MIANVWCLPHFPLDNPLTTQLPILDSYCIILISIKKLYKILEWQSTIFNSKILGNAYIYSTVALHISFLYYISFVTVYISLIEVNLLSELIV